MEKEIIGLTEEERKRFNELPPISEKQQQVIDSFANLMLERIREEKNHE